MNSRGLLRRHRIALATLLVVLLTAGLELKQAGQGYAQVPGPADAIIDNGSLVQLGINTTGNLDVPGGTLSMPSDSTTFVGLRYIPTNGESLAPACLCEGWGVANADSATGTFSGYANEIQGGSFDLVVESATVSTGAGEAKLKDESAGTRYSSVVTAPAPPVEGPPAPRVRVTHNFRPSSSPNLYQIDVTIQNIGGGSIGDLRYRRVMDWDIAPFTFDEFVEIHVVAAAGFVRATTDGFDTANPLFVNAPGAGVPPTTLGPGPADYFAGPNDQGALFDFSFGALAAGASKTFTIFYGAAAHRPAALAAINSVGAPIYSLGIPSGPAAVNATSAPITTVASLLNFPSGVAARKGEVYIADRNAHVVWKIGATGLIRVAGLLPVDGIEQDGYNGDGIPALTAKLSAPSGLALDSSGMNLYVADAGNNAIRKIDLATGIISTVAGTPPTPGLAADGVAATSAALFDPRSVAVDAAGNIYFSETMNQLVRKVAGGIITTVAGVAGETTCPLVAPSFLLPPPFPCPVGVPQRLNSPLGVAVDGAGNVFIGDEGSKTIWNATPVIGGGGYTVTPVLPGTFNKPAGVAVDAAGHVYVAEVNNQVIRRVSFGGADGPVTTTVAGTFGVAGFSGDGGLSPAATLDHPVAVTVDAAVGDLYIGDLQNQKIRKVGGPHVFIFAIKP